MPADIAGIYVVGGASSLPIVGPRPARALRQPRAPLALPLRRGIAIGLAIAADEKAGLQALRPLLARLRRLPRRAAAEPKSPSIPIFSHERPLPTRARAAPRGRAHLPRRAQRRSLPLRRVRRGRPQRRTPRRHGQLLRHLLSLRLDRLRETKLELGSPSTSTDSTSKGPLIRETYALNPHGIVEVRIENLDDHYEFAYRLSPRPPGVERRRSTPLTALSARRAGCTPTTRSSCAGPCARSIRCRPSQPPESRHPPAGARQART